MLLCTAYFVEEATGPTRNLAEVTKGKRQRYGE